MTSTQLLYLLLIPWTSHIASQTSLISHAQVIYRLSSYLTLLRTPLISPISIPSDLSQGEVLGSDFLSRKTQYISREFCLLSLGFSIQHGQSMI